MRKIFLLLSTIAFFSNNGIAQTATQVVAQDTRNASTTPSTYEKNLQFHFKAHWAVGLPSSGNGWAAVIGLRGWSYDNSGDKAHEIAFTDDNQIRVRSGYSPTWEAWRRIIVEDNNSDVYLTQGSNGGVYTSNFLSGHIYLAPYGTGNISYFQARRANNQGTSELRFRTMNNGNLVEAMHLAGNGNVGIGTLNINDANYKLFVETGIRTRKVKVDVSNWADYVFSPSYKLPSLKEVEAFIKLHHHLPGILSEAEVKAEGLDLGDNQAALLKKIEELTLYIIDQQKQIEKLKEENCRMNDLEKEIESIKKLLSNQNNFKL